jgi:hypothetical protein
MRKKLSPFFLYQSNDVTVITKAKVASRYMVELFLTTENPYIYIDIDINNYQNGNQKYFEKLNLLLSNKFNGDVYFLYRNPTKRLYSGIVEDTLRIYDYHNIFEKYELNLLVNKHSINVIELQHNLRLGNYNFFIEDAKYIEFTKDIVRNWIDWQLKLKPLYTDHTEPYMDIMHKFSNKLINNNVFFINIDDSKNDLKSIFKKYNSLHIQNRSIANQKELSHSKFYDSLDDIFNEKNEYIKFKNEFISIDNSFYELLENSNSNILKKQ